MLGESKNKGKGLMVESPLSFKLKYPRWVSISQDLNSLTRCHNRMSTGCSMQYKSTVTSVTIIHWEMVSRPHLCREIFRVFGIFSVDWSLEDGLEIWQEGCWSGRTATLSTLPARLIVLCLAGKQEVMDYTSIFQLVLTHGFLPDVCLHTYLYPVVTC